MVYICNQPYSHPSPYDAHFEQYPYPLSDFQKYAVQAIVDGHHVLVTAHTGSGKTLPAEFAIQHFVSLGKKLFIQALSKRFPIKNFPNFLANIRRFRLV